jgi:hypothetical protein
LDAFPIQNGLKQGDALSPSILNFALGYAIRKVQKQRGTGTERDTSAYVVDVSLFGLINIISGVQGLIS